MPYHFQYVPPSGPLSGQSLEEQTARAINELGGHFDQVSEETATLANQALNMARGAESAANEALGTANQAISHAQDAAALAHEAKGESDTALAVAQDARDTVNEAVDAASNAASLAGTAQTMAEEAKTTADAAQAEAESAAGKAVLAESMAQAALDVQSGNFAIDQNPVNADELISSAKIYAATEIINTPATAPAFLEVMANSDETAVTQAVWSEGVPQQYLRTGLTVWGVNAGQSDFTLQALPDNSEAAVAEGALSIINDGATMSAAFAPGGFNAAEADDLTLYGELRFIVGEDFLGTILCDDMEIARVTEIDSGETGTELEAVIINGGMASDNADIAILAAEYEADTLVLHIRAAWKDRSHATTWGGWVSGAGGAGDAAGLPLGAWIWSPLKKVPFGFLDISKDNGLLSRSAFPQLWETVKDDGNVVSEADYQASIAQFGGCGSFSSGDGATTFRLPMIAGLYARAYDPDKPDLALGKCLGDAIRNITGTLHSDGAGVIGGFRSTATGAFDLEAPRSYWFERSSAATTGCHGTASFNAANVVPTADENRPKTVCQTPIMKVYGAVADAGEANIAALIAAATTDLAAVRNALPGASSASAAGLVQLATAAEAQAGADAFKAITPATLKGAFTQSFSGNGYCKLPSGLIMQWMSASSTWTGSPILTTTVTLPLTFPGYCIFAMAMDYNSVLGSTTVNTIRWRSDLGDRKSILGFEATGNPTGYNIFAVGY